MRVRHAALTASSAILILYLTTACHCLSPQVCEQANKKTLGPEHVVAALQELGFGDFVAEVEAHWQQVKEEVQVNTLNINLQFKCPPCNISGAVHQ